ncbi:hypothetical protein HPB47_019493 [Ixodes persulcatus]|uniref:Uncharacterized protein n=1 Tax=Ixodes persulcatus TaxID=34615 RepID=A0AC60QI12_IXOPE|nr:hypothetical protein HPB47_019493 [Ixodes persulcatus]
MKVALDTLLHVYGVPLLKDAKIKAAQKAALCLVHIDRIFPMGVAVLMKKNLEAKFKKPDGVISDAKSSRHYVAGYSFVFSLQARAVGIGYTGGEWQRPKPRDIEAHRLKQDYSVFNYDQLRAGRRSSRNCVVAVLVLFVRWKSPA